jgi:hypothetical protein
VAAKWGPVPPVAANALGAAAMSSRSARPLVAALLRWAAVGQGPGMHSVVCALFLCGECVPVALVLGRWLWLRAPWTV